MFPPKREHSDQSTDLQTSPSSMATIATTARMDYIDICRRELDKSNMNHRHGAMIIYRNKVISSHNYLRSDQHHRSIHAEVAAIQKFMVHYPKRFLQEASLLVIRVNRSGEVCNSKPCPACQKYITKHGIPVTYYSS